MMKSIAAATLTFLLLDALWLGFIAKQLYINELGSMLRLSAGSIQPLWWAAVVVYVALIGGIVLFVVPKAGGSVGLGLLYGALFGFVTYATYDFTNLAVMANWPVNVTLIDVAWGMVICGLSSAVAVWVGG